MKLGHVKTAVKTPTLLSTSAKPHHYQFWLQVLSCPNSLETMLVKIHFLGSFFKLNSSAQRISLNQAH